MLEVIKSIEWFAIIAILLLVIAVALALWVPALWVLALVLSAAAIVSALFSYRT